MPSCSSTRPCARGSSERISANGSRRRLEPLMQMTCSQRSLFKRAAHRYEMCLLTNDTTLRLRIRLLAAETDRRLLAGVLTKGLFANESV